MRQIVAVPLLLVLLVLMFGFGGYLLMHVGDTIDAGELTYARKGHPSITASPGHHAFSYYYQLAFFLSLAGFVLLLGVALCMYAVAKLLRVAHGGESAWASAVYAKATLLAWIAITLFATWFLLHVFRYWLVA